MYICSVCHDSYQAEGCPWHIYINTSAMWLGYQVCSCIWHTCTCINVPSAAWQQLSSMAMGMAHMHICTFKVWHTGMVTHVHLHLQQCGTANRHGNAHGIHKHLYLQQCNTIIWHSKGHDTYALVPRILQVVCKCFSIVPCWHRDQHPVRQVCCQGYFLQLIDHTSDLERTWKYIIIIYIEIYIYI